MRSGGSLFVVFEILIGLIIAIILAGITIGGLNLGLASAIFYPIVGGLMVWKTEWKTTGWTVVCMTIFVVMAFFA